MTGRRVGAATAVAVAACAMTGCSASTGVGALGATQMMVPNTPGGGYDLTARSVASVLEATRLDSNVDVFNVVGPNETVAMQRLMKESGNADLMMTMGLGMVGTCIATRADVRPSDATALADLTKEPDGIIVPANSRFRTLRQLIRAWKADPASIRAGGGSSRGGPHYLFVMELAHAVGIPPRKVRYTPYSGDGQMLPALLDHTITFGASGLGEYRDQIAAGQVRVLATSAPTGSVPFRAPTLKASGINLVFMNWHGILAPPGISPDERRDLIAMLTKMHKSAQWKRALKQNGWTDAFLTGPRFESFLESQQRHVAIELAALGLDHPSRPDRHSRHLSGTSTSKGAPA